LFFFLPVAAFLLRGVFDPSFTLKHYRTALTEGVYLTILWRTLAISGATTLCCLALGYPVAYAIARASGRMRALALALVLIPFWTSILVRVFAWIALLGRNGVINSALMALGIIQSPIPMLYNTFAVLIGMTHVMLPYMILPCYAVMRNIPLELTAAAANLGATPAQAFRRIFMPLSVPGAAAGALLVFIVSGGFFVTPALMGGSSGMLVSQLIEQEVANATDWSFASALSGLLLTVTMALYVVYDRLVPLEDEAPT
jgi:ABC-type spermidine/putrescine transport system permease subunit I